MKSDENLLDIYSTVLNQCGIGIIVYNLQNDSSVSYNSILKNFGCADGEKIPDATRFVIKNKIIHPQDIIFMRNKFSKFFENSTSVSGLVRVRFSKDEPFVWVRMHGTVLEKDNRLNRNVIIAFESNNNEIELYNEKIHNEIVFESSSICHWDYDIARRTINFLSRDNHLIHGKTVIHDIPESNITQKIIAPGSVDAYRAFYQRLIDGYESSDAEIEMYDKKGASVWYKMHLHAVPSPFDKPEKAVGWATDITEEVDNRRRYEVERTRLDSMNAANILGRLNVDVSCNIIEKVIPYSIEAIDAGIDKTHSYGREKAGRDIKESDFNRLMPENLLAAFEDGDNYFFIEYNRMIQSRGAVRVRLTVKLIKNPDSKDIIAYLNFYDISESFFSKAILSAISQKSYDYIGIVNSITGEYRSVYSNNASYSLIPYYDNYDKAVIDFASEYKNFFYKPKDFTLANEAMKRANIVACMENKDFYCINLRLRHENDGGVHTYRMEYRYLNNRKEYFMISRTDITDFLTEEKRHKKLLEDALEKAEEATAAKTDFLSRMSHDIRTPMNAIIGTTELARSEINDKDAVLKYLNTIDSSSHFLLGLINDILDISKVERGAFTLIEEVFSEQDFVSAVEKTILPLMEARNITFESCLNATKQSILTDKLRYCQIFFNLLSNAVKYTPVGGHVEFFSEAIPAPEGKIGIRTVVRDNGIGMSKKYLTHLFEPFTRDDSSAVSAIQGTGLGLAIVKSIVDAMGGKITVHSKLGKGTEFIVDLFVKPAPDESLQVQEKAKASYDLTGIKILLVEDNEINVMVAKRLLENKGCIVTVANNGAQAVTQFEKSAQGCFDLIFMDIRMPVMGGVEAAEKIRALDRPDAQKIPIIAMTAEAFVDDRIKTQKAGMNAHLSKPIEPSQMYETIARFVGK
mgnify:CR=1 FL=1